ncbi:hypothetical protein DM02DRAFT_622748 [Periconia macrospinosa]|uniref:Uncharacterized protein n=1 Tax=Periconia macrospinosa TaxID=97972 RepID=A0A2V1E8R4_9PLEO|nr:hypothetical protein DM02DRAFT_622748 [Periconia macrospinosa]
MRYDDYQMVQLRPLAEGPSGRQEDGTVLCCSVVRSSITPLNAAIVIVLAFLCSLLLLLLLLFLLDLVCPLPSFRRADARYLFIRLRQCYKLALVHTEAHTLLLPLLWMGKWSGADLRQLWRNEGENDKARRAESGGVKVWRKGPQKRKRK